MGHLCRHSNSEVLLFKCLLYIILIIIKYLSILLICFIVFRYSALGGTVTQLYDQQPIYFGANDAKVLTKGLLATMNDHAWYSKKFLHDFPSDFH